MLDQNATQAEAVRLNETNKRREKLATQDSGAYPETYLGESPIEVQKIGHFVYEVSNVERTAKFWKEVMGFKEADRNEIGMIFLRCNADHHGIGLKPGKAGRRPLPQDGLNVEHLAMAVPNIDVLVKARDYLKANGIPIVFEGRKGAGCNIAVNFLDPDGYEFEIYCDMDQIDETGRTRAHDQYRRANSLEEAIANPVSKDW